MKTKFRAWNVESQCMLNHDFIVNTVIHNGEIVRDFSDILEHDDMYVLMQSTGLTDIGEDEVFEGDIVYDDYYELYGFVKYDEGSFVLEWDGVIEPLSERINTLPVVGNIHENPELLE